MTDVSVGFCPSAYVPSVWKHSVSMQSSINRVWISVTHFCEYFSHMEKRTGLNFGPSIFVYLPLFISQILEFIHIERFLFWWRVSEKPSLCYSPTWFCSMRCGKKKEGKNTCILPYLGIFFEDSDTCFKYFVPLSYFANLHEECLLLFMRNSIWKHWRCITIQ